MRNAFNALMAKNLGTHFLIKIKNPTQVGKAFDDLINGSRQLMKEKETYIDYKRLLEVKKPCKEKRDYHTERIRQKDRAEANFYCRYILAKKDVKIPLK